VGSPRACCPSTPLWPPLGGGGGGGSNAFREGSEWGSGKLPGLAPDVLPTPNKVWLVRVLGLVRPLTMWYT
jgi:hypothetical protein